MSIMPKNFAGLRYVADVALAELRAMFLLRCVFWLSIVYGSMSWGGDGLRRHGSFSATTANASEMGAVVRQAATSVSDFCRGREAQCIDDAARLTSIIQNAVAKDEAADIIVETADVPLPTPDPRRHAGMRALTQRP